MTLRVPCLQCGVLSYESLCPQHSTTKARGLGHAWRQLSKQVCTEVGRCQRCGATEDLTGDHIVPRSEGGRNVRENVQVLCRSCNSRKGRRARL